MAQNFAIGGGQVFVNGRYVGDADKITFSFPSPNKDKPMAALTTMQQSFADNLQEQLESKSSLSFRENRILEILQGRPSARRTRQIARMEAHTRAHLGMGGNESIDWSSIDWAALLQTILQLLMALLPLLLAL